MIFKDKELEKLNEYRRMKEIEKTDEEEPYYPLPREEAEDKFLEHLNPEKICEYIEQILRGVIFDSTIGNWKTLRLQRKINEEGISEIMVRVRSIINTNSVYSNLEEDDIRAIVVDFAKEMTLFLIFNYKRFNLNPQDINKIVNFCANMAYITLMRGKDALTLRLVRTAIQTKELITGGFEKKEKVKSIWERLGLK